MSNEIEQLKMLAMLMKEKGVSFATCEICGEKFVDDGRKDKICFKRECVQKLAQQAAVSLVQVESYNSELQVLESCRRQLAAIKDLSSLLEIRDQANAISQYLKAREGGLEVSNSGKQTALLAEAQAGKILKEMKKKGELRNQPSISDMKNSSVGGCVEVEGPYPPQELYVGKPKTLKDIGISKKESEQFQIAAEVLDKNPEWFDKHLRECNSKKQEFTKMDVLKQGKRLQNEEIKRQPVVTPKGLFDVLVIDPPWPLGKIILDKQFARTGLDYPTMTEFELEELKIPATENCHMFLWTTHRFLPMAMRLIPKWGFAYSCLFVWHKNSGIQPFGLPRYNCEFCVYARKGNPKFVDSKNFNLCFFAKSTGHSKKPDEFYDLIRRVTDGRRLDMFNRREIEGFETFGNQAFNPKKEAEKGAMVSPIGKIVK